MRRLALAALILLAGCSGDPASSRLKIGDECIVRMPEPDPKRPPIPTVDDGQGPYPVMILMPNRVRMKVQGTTVPTVSAASKVRVISDNQPADVRPAEKPYLADLDGAVDRRWVKVKVLDGKEAGEDGEIPRNTLQPVR